MALADTFTPKEIDALKALKQANPGITLQEATSRLNAAKEARPDLFAELEAPAPSGLVTGVKKFGIEKPRAVAETITEVGKGAAKGALKTVTGASALGESILKGIGRFFTPKQFEEKFGFSADEPTAAIQLQSLVEERLQLDPGQLTEPVGLPQEVGFFAEQAAEFALPGAKAVKFAKAKPLLTRAAIEAGTAGAVGAIQEGELEGAVVPAVTGGALPVIGAVGRKVLSPKRLIQKALGLGKTKAVRDAEKIATQAGFDGLEGFALEKGFKGSRDDIVDQIADAFIDAKSSKKVLLQGITKKTPNRFQTLLGVVRKEFDVPGQEKVLKEIDGLLKKKTLTAVELDRIRFLADDILPRSAFTDVTPKKTEGIQKLIDPIRRILEKLDGTGAIKRTNQEIRILYKLIPASEKAAKANILNQIGTRTIVRGGAAVLPILGIPGLQPFAIAAGIAEALTDIPQFSSNLAQLIKSLPTGKVPEIIKALIKGGIIRSTKEISER